MAYTDELEARLKNKNSDWLVKGDEMRTFGQYFKDCLEQNLISKGELAQNMADSPFNTSNVTYDSFMTKLTRWISGKAIPEDRNLMFRICIYMGLSKEGAQELFDRGLRASWVHYANREEVIYEFCIENKFGINAAYTLINTDYGKCDTAGLMDSPAGKKTLTGSITKFMGEEYRMLSAKALSMSRQEKLSVFEDFLKKNNNFFHNVRMTRVKLFKLMVDDFKKKNTKMIETDEADENFNPIYICENASNTMLADRLRAMRIPNAEDVEALKSKGQKNKRLYKLIDDDKAGDNNPIRKDIPLYLSGKRDIPRDIFIKMYIITEDYPDLYDLEALLMEAGYPGIYVRAADGFDAFVYHVFSCNEDTYNADYEKGYLSMVSKAVKDVKKALNDSDL